MRKLFAPMLALTAALSLEATVASAQVTSTRRIPVTKESPGEVVPPRVDTVTVTVYRTDTLRVYQTDTLRIRRVDTVRVYPPPPIPQVIRKMGGFYVGFAAGAALPTGDLDNAQDGSFHMDVPFGWDAIASPLGVRFDLGYSWFNTHNPFNNDINNVGNLEFDNLPNSPQIGHFGADLKLRLPITMPYTSRFQLYGVGGGSYSWYKDIVELGDGLISMGDFVGVAGAPPLLLDDSWHSKWGWNAGGGVQFGWGKTNLFLESRVISFNSRLRLDQVPIVLGISWF